CFLLPSVLTEEDIQELNKVSIQILSQLPWMHTRQTVLFGQIVRFKTITPILLPNPAPHVCVSSLIRNPLSANTSSWALKV
uniref:Uncharacterized protein n=1 Tax=Neogobius melanostomus TaxID=47308 RepID=A0A8C6U8T9_9GOBI